MSRSKPTANPDGHSLAPRRMEKARLDDLIGVLWKRGYRVLGPVPRDGAVLFDEVRTTDDLPVGLRDEQEAGRYRLVQGDPDRIFDVVNGPGSLKSACFAPTEPLLEVRRAGRGFEVEEVAAEKPALAFIGVRACDLAALAVQDRIFLHDRFADSHYAGRRANLLLIAVECVRSMSTCFCASMNTGPEARAGFDIALTEICDRFVVRTGSEAGTEIVAALDLPAAAPEDLAERRRMVDECAAGMQRRLDTSDLPALLYEEAESPRWDDVAQRCLSCTNCTMVCPTCFCHAVVEVPQMDGSSTQRVRQWDSCFSHEHAHIHGKNFRPHTRERYRQWLTHKLASWIDQFGTSGCVGCGRCITWCPVGIDITEEVRAIRQIRREREREGR